MRHGAQAGVEGRHLGGALGVDVAQRRLAEVRHVGARESADKALRADDAHLGPVELERAVAAVDDVDPTFLERGDHLVAAVGVPVVVAEDGQDRDVERTAGLGQDGRLLRLAVGGQIAGQQDHVDALGGGRERGGERAAIGGLAAVDVTRGGDPQPGLLDLGMRLSFR